MPEPQGHRWFAAFWEWLVNHETSLLRRVREEIVGGAKGRVLEIGCGVGANFPYYRDTISEVVATDPDPYMLQRARKRANEVGRAIGIQQAPAEELPFEDRSFDTVVCTWVLCTVRDSDKALSEVKRVLKPEGEFRFSEHVGYEGGVGAFWQNLISPIWQRLGAGCRLNRDSERSIHEAGFTIQEIESFKATPVIDPSRPCIKGVARPA